MTQQYVDYMTRKYFFSLLSHLNFMYFGPVNISHQEQIYYISGIAFLLSLLLEKSQLAADS